MYIWKRTYNPFQMGGSLNKNIKTNITEYQEIELAKGFKGVYIKEQGVFESESGGLVGDTVQNAIEDINSCDNIELMKSQVELAKTECAEAIEVSNDEFFK